MNSSCIRTAKPNKIKWGIGSGRYRLALQEVEISGCNAGFAVAGDRRPENPASFSKAQVKAWSAEGLVEFWGWQKDMVTVLRGSRIVCVSSYREGLPTELVQAAACARAIVTCYVQGCREVVRDNDNGLLVPARDAEALANALQRLIEDPSLRARMGERGRQRAVSAFWLQQVVSETLAWCRKLAPI